MAVNGEPTAMDIGEPVTPREGKSGVSYEVVLEEKTTPRPNLSNPAVKTQLSLETIQSKLQEAEDRRQSLEAQKVVQAGKETEKAKAAQQQVQMKDSEFRREAEEKLRRDIERKDSNRSDHVAKMQERVRQHLAHVETARAKLNDQVTSLTAKIAAEHTEKMEAAEKKREEHLTQIRDELREHEKHIEMVRNMCDEMTKQKQSTAQTECLQKLDTALKNKEKQLSSVLERLQEQGARAEQVRQRKASAKDSSPPEGCEVNQA